MRDWWEEGLWQKVKGRVMAKWKRGGDTAQTEGNRYTSGVQVVRDCSTLRSNPYLWALSTSTRTVGEMGQSSP